MRTYWSSEVAQLLGISPNTLRKWSIHMENAGYRFLRDDKNNRAYRDADIMALRKLQSLLSSRMSMENAVLAVVSVYMDDQITDVVPVDDRSFERYQALDRLIEFMERQQAFNQELLDQLRKRDEYIERVLKERDEKLTQTLNEILETKRMLAAAQEQQKRRWYQFWKK